MIAVAGILPRRGSGAEGRPQADSSVAASPEKAAAKPIDEEAAPLRRAVDPSGSPAVSTKDNSSPSMEVPRVLSALALVVALIFALRWAGKRWFGDRLIVGNSRAVELISRSSIGPRQSVMLLRVGRRLVVVADNGTQISPLTEISDPDEVASLVGQLRSERTESATRTFGPLFMRFSKENEKPAVVSTPAFVERNAQDAEEQDVSTARAQINGLMEQVRMVASQMNRS